MIVSLTLTREEFSARRRKSQTDLEEELRPAVENAVESGDWGIITVEVDRVYGLAYYDETGDHEGHGSIPPAGWLQQIEDTLEKTKGKTSATVDRITVWLATAILSQASIAASQDDPEELFLEWVTMHDGDVRHAHRVTDGQVRPIGEPYNVDGTPMMYPGDVSAPIELWINCRCTLRPTLASEEVQQLFRSQVAEFATPAYEVGADDETGDPEPASAPTTTCVVALPAEEMNADLPGEEQKHVTLLFIGEVEDAVAERLQTITEALAQTYEPFNASVAGSGVLGPDKAKVLLVEAHEFNALHGALEQDEAVASVLRSIDTHPHFVPHMTLTYGDMPDASGVETITIDRLAVWHGEEQTEYPLGASMEQDEALTAAAGDTRVPWHGVLAPEGIRSGDGRKFKEGSLRHRDLPLPLTWQKISDDGHKGNITVATIETAEMVDGQMRASGWFLDTPEANEVMGLIAEFGRFGVSVDADDATFEVDEDAEEVVFTDARVCSACIVPIPAFAEAWVALGEWDSSDSEPEGVYDEEVAAAAEPIEFVDVAPGRTEDGPGWLTHPVDTDRLRDYWTKGAGAAKIGWGTPGDFNRCRSQVAKYVKPQHLNGYCANRHYDALGFWPGRPVNGKALEFESVAEALNLTDTEPSEAISMTASVGLSAPAEWFQAPDLDRPTPITISDTGRVFGHIAEWGTCHIGFSGQCITPPHSMTDYAYFLTGEVALDNGTTQRVGNLTIGGGHAAPNLGMKPALAHYDSTSAVVADVNVGEDEHGIWFAGWIRPGTSPEMVTAFRASALSGDWRKVGGNLELVAALAVNVPGFGIPRPKVAASTEGQLSLVASGVVAPRKEEQPTRVEAEKIADSLAASVAAILEERAARRAQMQALAARIAKE